MAQGPAKKTQFPVEHHDLDGLADDDHSFYPKGVLGFASITSNQGSITSETTVTGTSLTVDIAANRLIRLTFIYRMQHDTVDSRSRTDIKESTTRLQQSFFTHTATGADGVVTVINSVILDSPSAGEHTYHVTAQPQTGTTVTLVAASNAPSQFIIEDIGPA